jgi:hypothetical protein
MPHIMDPNRPADGRAEQEINARLFRPAAPRRFAAQWHSGFDEF